VVALVESRTSILDDICVHEDDTNESGVLHLPVAYDEIRIAIVTTNLLHIHIVFCQNLQ